MSFVALLGNARATHHLTADMGSHLFSLFQALLPKGGDVVADLRLALEVRPVSVHAVCEVVRMLPGVPGQLVLHPRAQLCRDSSTWMQYKLARDTRQHADNLTDSMNRHWSDFKSRAEVSDYITSLREESLKEREEVRAHVRSQVMSRASVAKECYEAHRQPWEAEQLEEESVKKASTELSAEERIEQLRRTTEEMLTSRTEYVASTRSLALQAMREDAEEVAASRTVRRTAVVAAA